MAEMEVSMLGTESTAEMGSKHPSPNATNPLRVNLARNDHIT